MIDAPAPRVSGSLVLKRRVHDDQWFAKYRVGGRQYKRRIGPAWSDKGRPPDGYFTRRTATDALQAILTDARRTGIPAATRRRSVYTLEQGCRDWLRYLEVEKQRAPSTIEEYARTVDNHFLPAFGAATPLAQITADQIDAWISEKIVEGRLNANSLHKARILLNGVFKLAKRRKHVPTNPVADTEPLVVKRSGEFNVLSLEELHAVVRELAAEQDRAMVLTAALAGLRMGELRALRWRDLDFANQTIHVRRGYTRGIERLPKSGKVRSVPLSDQVAAALDDLSRRDYLTEPDDLVFVSARGNYVDARRLADRFFDAMRAAGLGHKRDDTERPFRWHDLRHTFGTLAVKVWDLRKVQGYMGHADISTTMGYVHHVPKTDDANALSALVEASLGAVAQVA